MTDVPPAPKKPRARAHGKSGLNATLKNLSVKFVDLVKLPPATVKAELLARLEDIYTAAMERTIVNKSGDEYPNADCNAATNVVKCVAQIVLDDAAAGSEVGDSDGASKPTVAAISAAAEKLEGARRLHAVPREQEK